MGTIPFQFVGLRYSCQDCHKGVGDRNGISVIRQMEAHLNHYPDHTVELNRTGRNHFKHPERQSDSND